MRGAFFMGRIAARVEPWDVPREKGRGRRGLREINSEAARSPAARARFMGRIAAREEPWDAAREKGRGRRGLRAIDPAARERPRIRASFNRKNEKMEPVGTVARRVRCRFRVLIFRQCLRCGHAFSTQPRWLKRSVMSCSATAALADAAQPYWLKPFSDEQPSTQLRWLKALSDELLSNSHVG